MTKKDYATLSLALHKEKEGKLAIRSIVPVMNRDDLSIAYTPGVAAPCLAIAKEKRTVYDYTSKGRLIAVVTDGTAVLGLGDIGPEASLPVMEGKCILFKEFGGVDAIPIALATTDVDEIVRTVKLISPGLGGINLEDISAPRCFEVEEKLKAQLDIPVFHDDQHGTAIVVLAGLINALKVTDRMLESTRIVVSGAGAAGVAITKLLLSYGAKDLIMADREGALYPGRAKNMNPSKEAIARVTNPHLVKGTLADALIGADVFIGVSGPGIATRSMIEGMSKDSIVFAMANPIPEIMPEEAAAGGAAIIATGRSDYPNQVNNVLAFPGIFKGTLEAKAIEINEAMKIAAAECLADMVKRPSAEMIIPDPFTPGLAEKVAKAVEEAAYRSKARMRA